LLLLCTMSVHSTSLPQLVNPFPLPRSIPFYPTVPRPHFRFPNDLFFYSDRLSACRPTPNLKGQSAEFITPGAGWPSYTPRHWVPNLVAFYDLHGHQWDYSFPLSPHGEIVNNTIHKLQHVTNALSVVAVWLQTTHHCGRPKPQRYVESVDCFYTSHTSTPYHTTALRNITT
jgi:hypothetical protein